MKDLSLLKSDHVLANNYSNAKTCTGQWSTTYVLQYQFCIFFLHDLKKKHNLKKTVFFKLCIFFTELLMYLFHWIGDNCVLSKFSLPIIVFSFIQISYSYFSFLKKIRKAYILKRSRQTAVTINSHGIVII